MGSVHGAHLLMQATEDMQAVGPRGTAPSSSLRPVSTPEAALNPDVDALKKDLRTAAMAKRAAAVAISPGAGERLADALLAAAPRMHFPAAPESVSAFWPMRDEIDVRPLIHRLTDAGYRLGLPATQGRGKPLVFRRWRPDMDLVDGGFGTRVPPADAPEIVPSVLIVPLLAFDRRGYRLGYGGGFYDRTLAELAASRPVLAIGVAFAAQEVEEVPHEAHDVPLPWIVTEQGAIETPIAAAGAETKA